MATTKNTYTQSGSTTDYSFTFPYIKQADVKVSLDNVVKSVTSDYTFPNATTVRFNSAPTAGTAIAIYRSTDDTGLVATFYPGSAIRSADLNDNYTQNLYSTQENTNDATDALNNSRVLESGAYVSAITKASAAVTTANTASTNASSAVTTANTASTNASSAVTTANTASTNATNAVNTANAADTIADSAKLATDRLVATTSNNGTTWTVTGNNTNASTDPKGLGYAITTADSAVSTANTASTNATSALNNSRESDGSGGYNTAISVANTAKTTADSAAADVAAAVLYTSVANKAALEALTPSEDGYYEVKDSSSLANATWGTPTYTLSGIPGTYPSSALDGITTRLSFTVSNKTFAYSAYTVNDADNRYLAPGDLLDEDNMASNSATKVASQQSVKAYADTKQTLDADLTALSSCQTGGAAALAALTSTEIEILDGATVTTAELNILDGVTSTAAELNILDGVTSTTAELNLLDGVTSTTAELNLLDGVTSTTAELNLLDGVTSTTAELNILDGVTSTAAELNILDGVTSTAAELNILDGVTSTAAELNLLDGVTSTTAELNLLDGVTATTAELNYVDGVTSAIQTQLNAKGTGNGDAVLANDQNWTGAQRGAITALTDASTIAVDFNSSNNFSVTLGGSRTLGQPSNQVAGQSGSIFVTQDGTGNHTLSYHADWKWAGGSGSAPTVTATANAVSRIDYIVAAANKIHAVATLAVA